MIQVAINNQTTWDEQLRMKQSTMPPERVDTCVALTWFGLSSGLFDFIDCPSFDQQTLS
jgi:hypothetical protein